MYRMLALCAMVLFLGCAVQEEPLPPLPPPSDDLTTWASPARWTPPPIPQAPAPRPPGPQEQVVAYREGEEVRVLVPMGTPATVQLEAGEQIQTIMQGDRTPVAEGEAPRWDIKTGMGSHETPYVFITAREPGLRQGLVILTSRRTYHLALSSVSSAKVRAVRWTYTDTSPPPQQAPWHGLWPDPRLPHAYHVGYEISSPAPAPAWTPRQVVDDGTRMYLLLSPVALVTDVPLVREMTPQGPRLLNTRLVGTVLVIDKLVGRVELRLGVGDHAEVVQLQRGAALQTVMCPGDGRCPQFPSEGN